MNRLLSICLIWMCHLALFAQSDDDYDPVNPPNPDEPTTYYKVTLSCEPAGAGSFNWNSGTTKVAAGAWCSINAYANTNYTFREWRVDGQAVSDGQTIQFTMPAADKNLVAVYDYNPINPSNPGKNYWNAETGEVIIDEFTTGDLSSAIYTVIGNNNSSEVKMITVAGIANQYDWGILNNYRNCNYLDLSRTTGMTRVPSYNFSGNPTLESIILPASIDRIEYQAFYNCTALTNLTCFALTPPSIGSNAFYGVNEDLVVYVPASAVEQYQEANGWKNFIILPLQDEVSALEVNLPEGTDPTIYKDMYIELINTKSGQKQRYVITNRTTYTFSSLIHNTQYNVYLKNAQGNVLGQINGVDIQKENVSVTFSSLLVPRELILKVLLPNGEDVTNQTTITWMDEKGTFLNQGNKLSGMLEGMHAKFRIGLPQTLGMEYIIPADSLYEVQANNNINVSLEAIPQTIISGIVRDIKTNQPLNKATISVSQLMNGIYSKSFTTKTDNEGRWSLQVFGAKTDITASMDDYVSKTQSFEELVAEIPAFELKDINGTSISLNLTYTSIDGETQAYYSDYANVAYTVFNKTTGQPVTELNVQYPQIILMEQLPAGTELLITATSKNQKFIDVSGVAIVDSLDRASVTLPIKQLGGISASFAQTDNMSVTGILYDANDRLVKKYEYASATLTISELQDGEYTLVTMANSQFFNSIAMLSQFATTGLREGVDYVKNKVTVKSGELAQVNNQLIPFLDEAKLYYTGNNTSFTVNKTQVTAGQYLTLSSRIDFKAAYANEVNDVSLIVDLPEGSSFVDNSVMVGNAAANYTISNHRAIIPLSNYNDRIRFCFIPVVGGDYSSTASVQFTMGGRTITQPIGNANYSVTSLSINVPSTIVRATMTVSGTANGKSSVDIYDNSTLIGHTTSMASGSWVTNCKLSNPNNLSIHNIYAKVTTERGVELISETKQVLYDISNIVPEKVTMLYYNQEFDNQYNIIFDLVNGTVTPSSYYFFPYKNYPNWWETWETEPKDFTFIADLTNNDTTVVDGVTIRVYTVEGTWRNLEAKYNTILKKWVAVSQFREEELPVGVEVEIDANVVSYLDSNVFEKGFDGAKDLQEYIKSSISQTEELALTIVDVLDSEEDSKDRVNALMEELLSAINFNDEISPTNKSVSELLNETENLLKTNIAGLLNIDAYNFEEISKFFDGFSIETRDDLNEETLLNEGFQSIKCTEGKEYYYKYTNNEYIIAYLPLSVYIVYNIQGVEDESQLSRIRRANDVSDLTTWQGKVYLLCDKLNAVVSAVTNAVDGVISQVDALKGKCQNQLSDNLGKLLQDSEEPFLTQKEINDLTKANANLSKQIKQCEAISNWLQKNLKNFRISNGAGVAFSLFDVYNIIDGIKEDGNEIINLYYSVPDCPDDTNDDDLRKSIRNWGIGCFMFYAGKLSADIVQINSVVVGVTGAVPTGGSSLTAVGIALGIAAANFTAELAYKWQFDKNIERFKNEIRKIKCSDDKCPRCGKKPCECKDDCPKCGQKPCRCNDKCPICGQNPCKCWKCKKCGHNPCVCKPYPKIDPIHDPSGYVYEGVMSNRVQGVTATVYYKEEVEDMYGDLHENVVLWDAKEYAQENPLFTDEYGMYRWDVPQGLWQVKFEKEGYQTTYSEWLPVPPPQLDVNIAMTQMLQPTVKKANAFDEGVEMEFDKYMDPETLTGDNIKVMHNGNALEGTIELLNKEVAYEGKEETYASKVRFKLAEGLELPYGEEVQLNVSRKVKSYAGVTMEEDYTQAFTVEPKVRLIAVDSLINIAYGGTRTLTVAALPADASKGKKMVVKSLSKMIATASATDVTPEENGDIVLTLDENGQAEFVVSGELPGSTVMSFAVEDTEVEGQMKVNVKDATLLVTIAPRASRVSGTQVYRGTEIRLTSETEDAEIYYTLDGSCPCNTETALKYNADEPIIIASDSVTIKAMAKGHDLEESDVAEFTYLLKKTTVGYQMPEGWTWMSHNLEDAVPVSAFQNNAERIVGQTQEQVNDPVVGMIGNLNELQPTEAYKIKVSAETENRLQGYEFNATKNSVAVVAGWNWIGYPMNQAMTLAEALNFYDAAENDFIVGQDGYAEFTAGEWKGTLEGMKPGQGYLYKSAVSNEIHFNTTIVSVAASRMGMRDYLMNSPWAPAKHGYPNVMPLTAQLYDGGTNVGSDDYVIGAFAGSECRGVGIWKENHLLMNVYGQANEELRFVAKQLSTDLYYDLTEQLSFTADNTGTWNAPYVLTIGSQTTDIAKMNDKLTVTPTVAKDHITVTAGGKNISYLTLTNMGGQTVLSLSDLGKGATVTLGQLPEGMYIVTVKAEGQSYYRKIMKANK